MLKPTSTHLLCIQEDITSNGVIIPDGMNAHNYLTSKVLFVGEDVGNIYPTDRVYHYNVAPKIEVKIDGVTYLLIKEADVFAMEDCTELPALGCPDEDTLDLNSCVQADELVINT